MELTTDQRGLTRIVNGTVDIGTCELPGGYGQPISLHYKRADADGGGDERQITVQLEDASGNPVAAGSGGESVSLGTTSAGGVFRNTEDTATITSVTIPAGSSTASLKYNDTLAGTPTLTASAQRPALGHAAGIVEPGAGG